jgi:peptidoglycan/xylan/chitin deacetylase (PgdA/CDA1 family)
MNTLASIASPIYRWVTTPWRNQLAARFDRTRTWPAAILFYHRVADREPNDWSLSNDQFRRHLDWYATVGKFVSIRQVQLGQQLGKRDQLEIVITFDDGYRETLEQAIPLLVERSIPCTFFVSTEYAEKGSFFPHDLAIQQRHHPVTIHDVRRIAGQGIEIGCHTHSHLNLGLQYDRDRLTMEIRDCRHRLQDWSGQSIDYFSFPFGLQTNMSQSAIDMVYEAGFKGFLSAYGAWNLIPGDDFHLARIHAPTGLEHLQNWMTLDPRKVYRPATFEYERRATVDSVPSDQAQLSLHNESTTPVITFGIANPLTNSQTVDL